MTRPWLPSLYKRKFIRWLFLFVVTLFVSTEILLLRRFGSSLDSINTSQEEISPNTLNQFEPLHIRMGDVSAGSINGLPLNLQNVGSKTHTKPKSLLQCVGEDYQKDDWWQRSCSFRFMCFDLDTRNFTIYSRPEDTQLKTFAIQRPFMDLSQTLIQTGTTISLGGINRKWGKEISRLEWFPTIIDTPPTIFYSLPENVIMIPHHSMAALPFDPLDLILDNFLPIFNLMHLFQLDNKDEPMLLRYTLTGSGLFESCDDPALKGKCDLVLGKYWPMMTRLSSFITSQQETKFHFKSKRQSNLVCAKQGLAGIGALTDHGTYKTDGRKSDYGKILHNHGRGDLFWKFREFCLENLALTKDRDFTGNVEPPYKVVIAEPQSKEWTLEKQTAFLQQNMNSHIATVQTYEFEQMTLIDQVKLVTQADVYISVGFGEGAVASLFLPPGSTLIIFYDPTKQHRNSDFFNNLSHIRVNWFPVSVGVVNLERDSNALMQAVQWALKNKGKIR